MLDRAARGPLRTLSKNNADMVARHLVMAGRLIDLDPEMAYQHAQAAQRRAGRVDVVRESLALTAYATGRFAEALRELRTVRRLSGIDAHRPMEADCERGLGRPERALAIVAETDMKKMSEADRVELSIVASGARADLGENEAGLLVLESQILDDVKDPELLRRLKLVRADRLTELGRTAEADALRDEAGPEPEPEDEIVVFDVAEEAVVSPVEETGVSAVAEAEASVESESVDESDSGSLDEPEPSEEPEDELSDEPESADDSRQGESEPFEKSEPFEQSELELGSSEEPQDKE